jgi:hypothetical protein
MNTCDVVQKLFALSNLHTLINKTSWLYWDAMEGGEAPLAARHQQPNGP